MEQKTRGDVAPGKKQVNWRIDIESLKKLEEESKELGYGSITAFVNYLFKRYTRGEVLKRGERK